MERTQAEMVADEKKILVDYAGYVFADIFHAIRPSCFLFSETGGYLDVANARFHAVSTYAKYDYKVDKPYYDFDFRAREFQLERVLWHLHPFQGEHVHNSYPSFQDLNTALERPGKVFVLVSKLGSYVYRSTVRDSLKLNVSYYEETLMPFFREYRRLAAVNGKPFRALAKAATLKIAHVAPHEDLWKCIRAFLR